MKKKYKLLLGVLIGICLVFFVPLVPIFMKNKIGEYGGIWWNSGLMCLVSLKDFLLIEVIGGLMGFLITFIYVGGTN